MNLNRLPYLKSIILASAACLFSCSAAWSQSWELRTENIDSAFAVVSGKLKKEPFRPAYHLTPPAGSMGDPNGGIFYDGWYHIFYGLNPFAYYPSSWYWAHARSRDLVHWEHMENGLTPALELGMHAIGSGSTIATDDGKKLAFHSYALNKKMAFWRVEFTNKELSRWKHSKKNPVITLDHPGLPPFDGFWRDPFVFQADGRFFLIACADLLEENYVTVPIFESTDKELSNWEYKGELFRVPKHKYRNLEVPEFFPLKDKWIFMASTDAPVDRVNYFIGTFDLDKLRFTPEAEGPIDYSNQYYAQETIKDDKGDLYILSWIPGWDREWIPTYMNEPLKNSNQLWNGAFSLPRKLLLRDGELIQRPVDALKGLRAEHLSGSAMSLPVKGAFTATFLSEEIRGDQLELHIKLDLLHASACGLNLLADSMGQGGLPVFWSGDVLTVDGISIPIKEWKTGEELSLEIFVDKKIVEVFVNGGKYCVSRQVREENIKGDRLAFTSLGGTARLVSIEGWKMKRLNF